MPFCDVGEYTSDVDGAGIDMKTGLEEGCSVQLYYQLFGHGTTKVLLIPGVCRFPPLFTSDSEWDHHHHGLFHLFLYIHPIATRGSR